MFLHVFHPSPGLIDIVYAQFYTYLFMFSICSLCRVKFLNLISVMFGSLSRWSFHHTPRILLWWTRWAYRLSYPFITLSFILNSSARTVCPLALHRPLCYPSPYSCYSFRCERVPSLASPSFQLSSFGTSARMDMRESFFTFTHFSSTYCFVFSSANFPFNLGVLGQSPQLCSLIFTVDFSLLVFPYNYPVL